MIRTWGEHSPTVHDGVFVADDAQVMGQVTLGRDASVWYGCVLRGDVMPLVIGDRTNIQDLSLAHGTSGKFGVQVGAEVTVGHRAILHGCTVGDRCLIGMGAILLDGCVIEPGCIIAAGAVVSPGTVVPERTMVAGIPAKPRRDVTDAEYQSILDSAQRYIDLAKTHRNNS